MKVFLATVVLLIGAASASAVNEGVSTYNVKCYSYAYLQYFVPLHISYSYYILILLLLLFSHANINCRSINTILSVVDYQSLVLRSLVKEGRLLLLIMISTTRRLSWENVVYQSLVKVPLPREGKLVYSLVRLVLDLKQVVVVAKHLEVVAKQVEVEVESLERDVVFLLAKLAKQVVANLVKDLEGVSVFRQ